MKKIISLALSICLLMTINSFSVSSDSISKLEVNNLDIIGEKMSAEDYKDIYGKSLNDRSCKSESMSYQQIKIKVNRILVLNDNIVLDYQIAGYRETIKGILYNSRREMNNIVAVFDCRGNYSVLFFEITTGYKQENLLYNIELKNKPHIKLYLQDSYDNILLFETELPTAFSSLTIKKSGFCDVNNDYLWYINIAEQYVKQPNSMILTSNNVIDENAIKRNIAIASGGSPDSTVMPLSSSTEPMIWGSTGIYEMSVSNGYEQTTYMFYPFGYVRGTQVAVSGENTWWGTIEISEHASTKVIGSSFEPTITYGINRFSIRNPKISFVCGDYTLIVRTYIDGRVKENSSSAIFENGSEINAKILKKAFSYVPYGKTAEEILSWLSLITQQVDDELVLGQDGVDLSGGYVSGAKFELGKEYNLTKYTQSTNGHSLKMHACVSRTTSTTYMTTGAIRISYDVYTNIYDKHDSFVYEKSFLYSDTNFENMLYY